MQAHQRVEKNISVNWRGLAPTCWKGRLSALHHIMHFMWIFLSILSTFIIWVLDSLYRYLCLRALRPPGRFPASQFLWSAPAGPTGWAWPMFLGGSEPPQWEKMRFHSSLMLGSHETSRRICYTWLIPGRTSKVPPPAGWAITSEFIVPRSN